MSWFDFTSFRRKQHQEPPPPSPGGPPEAPDSPSGQTLPPIAEEGKKWVGFDPTGLERAAKAARELDKSRKFEHAMCMPSARRLSCYAFHRHRQRTRKQLWNWHSCRSVHSNLSTRKLLRYAYAYGYSLVRLSCNIASYNLLLGDHTKRHHACIVSP